METGDSIGFILPHRCDEDSIRSPVLSAKNSTLDIAMDKNSEFFHDHMLDIGWGILHASSSFFLRAHMVVRKHYFHFPAKKS